MLKIIISLLGITSVIFASPVKEERRYMDIAHSNDLNIIGETAGVNIGDDLLTGTLDISYKEDKSFYEISIKSYTQKYIIDGERIDTLTLGYLRDVKSGNYESYQYNMIFGIQFIHSGDFGGESLQSGIHSLTGNSHYNMSYSNETHTAFGFEGRIYGLYALNQNFNIYNNLEITVNLDKSGSGKLELGVEGNYENFSFWIATVGQHIEPFNHSIVEFSTPDKDSIYALLGGSVKFLERYELMLETSFGGAPLGEKDDYCTQIRLRYFFR